MVRANGVIVNADDFGKNESVNQAILEAFEKKYIHRTTLMTNMPAAKQAVELAKQAGLDGKVGIHLNLTEGKPLTDSIRKNPLFCDENGVFHAGFHKSTKSRIIMDQQSVLQMREELRAQLAKYAAWDLTLWHLDSHHHVHTNYPVFRALKPLQKEHAFASIRLSRNLYQGGNALMNLYKSRYNAAVKKCCKETTEFFGSYRDCMEYFGNTDQFGEVTETIKQDFSRFVRMHSLEIMVHPMYDTKGRLTDTDVLMEREAALYG